VLYPQNGDRILTIDSVTSLHAMYTEENIERVAAVTIATARTATAA